MKTIKYFFIFILFILISNSSFGQQRKVLLEQFTNSGCPPCAGNTPLVADFVNNHSDSVLMISYHTSFPYQDSMYFENPVQSNARVAFYNIVSVPRSVVDGNFYSGNSVTGATSGITVRTNVLPKYLITFTSAFINNAQISLIANFESIDANNLNEQLVAHVVLVEKNVLKSSYVCCAGANIENEYPWVMRKMLPSEFGTPLVNKQQGGIDVITLNSNLNNIKDISQLRAIAFVQNIVTKEVYQAEISEFSTLSSSSEIPENSTNIFYFNNPLKESLLQIEFSETDIEKIISIFDIQGREVKSVISKGNKFEVIDLGNLKNGMYLLSITNKESNKIKKLIIQK